jgi:hypothetical protein
MSLKSNVFEKLDNAVQNADPLTVDGVQILALAASAVKNLNEGTDVEDDVYLLGNVGEIGFGVATAKPEHYEPLGLIPLSGHDDILSSNYGNYLHIFSGSQMVFVPKHWYKEVNNTPYFSDRAIAGYVLDRSFINKGLEIDGVFVHKFGGTNNNGVFSSQRGKDPMSTNSAHNPIGSLSNAPTNTYGGLYKAVKSMSSEAFLEPVYVRKMLSRIARGQGQFATSTTACAYIDVNPKMPKGNLNNALKDYNDASVTFVASGYANCALTGSGSDFAKTTHNGQDSGIADICGNMWNVVSGFIRMDANGFLVLKESTDIRTIADDGTGATGAYNVALYDVIDISDVVFDNSGWTYLGNGTNQVFGFSTDRTSATYKKTSVGIPLVTGVSGAGTTQFGNDGLYRYLRNEMSCLVGGDWSSSSDAGADAVTLNFYRTYSYNSVGGRACLYPRH